MFSPAPTLHVLHPSTLDPIVPSIHPLVQEMPVFSLSGRLLVFTTSEPATRPGADGLGSILTAGSVRRSFSHTTDGPGLQSSAPPDSQPALLSSAVEIGGGVAKGVWAGLKLGAQAAQRARNGRLAKSAPAETSLAIEEEHSGTGSSGNSETSSLLEEQVDTLPSLGGGWVKIVDLKRSTSGPKVIAHFRLPPTKSGAIATVDGSRRTSDVRSVSLLSFNASGTQLLITPQEGRVAHVVEIHPNGVLGGHSDVSGQVWHLYELRRGNTSANVCDALWSQDGRWIGIGTSKGTTRRSKTLSVTDIHRLICGQSIWRTCHQGDSCFGEHN